MCRFSSFFFFFNDTATTEIYTLSLHDALPICRRAEFGPVLPESRALACLILELRQIPRAAASDRCVPLARARDRHAATGVALLSRPVRAALRRAGRRYSAWPQ